jgi:hypothetical protein
MTPPNRLQVGIDFGQKKDGIDVSGEATGYFWLPFFCQPLFTAWPPNC